MGGRNKSVARELLLVMLDNCRIHLPTLVRRNSFGGTNQLALSCDHCSNLVK
jgi:hypothetical protein